MLKAMIIGASQEAIHVIQVAQKQNIYVIAVDGNKRAKGLEYADKAVVADISDIEAISRIAETEKPDFTIPIPIGYYLISMAYVNEKYGLRGSAYESVKASVDKWLFHQKLAEAGLRKEYVLLVKKGENFVWNGKYPVVVKPRYGSGNRNVYC